MLIYLDVYLCLIRYVTKAQLQDSEIDGDSIENLMRVLGIKESKADQIGQKVHIQTPNPSFECIL